MSTDLGTIRKHLTGVSGGVEAVKTLQQLGLWSTQAHSRPDPRTNFPKNISRLSPAELSDLQSRVTAEAGRIFELLGILNGAEARLKIEGKQVRAAARSRVRNEWPEDQKAPTKSEIDDLAEEDFAVIEFEAKHAQLAVLLAGVLAVKEATILYKETISREITWRGTQIQGRLY